MECEDAAEHMRELANLLRFVIITGLSVCLQDTRKKQKLKSNLKTILNFRIAGVFMSEIRTNGGDKSSIPSFPLPLSSTPALFLKKSVSVCI